jgi:CRP-like cAMP-binding protein
VGFLRSRSTKVDLLRKVPLFKGLSQRQLEQVARLVDEYEAPVGKRLATTGEIGRELFIIVSGQARVSLPRGRTVRLGPGEFFGEMSLVDGGPRSASVEAVTPMRLLVVGRREFWALLGEAPTLNARIMCTLATRLRAAEGMATA